MFRRILGYLLVIVIVFFIPAAKAESNDQADDSNMRDVLSEQVQERIKQINQTRQEYQAGISATVAAKKGEYQETRQEIITKMQETRDRIREQVRDRLLSHADRVIQHLERLKERISNHSGLTDSQKAIILADVDTLIEQLQDQQSDVQVNETEGEVKATATELRTSWQQVFAIHRKTTGFIVIGNFSNFLNRLDSIGARVETKLEEFSDQGQDTSQALQSLQDFRDELSIAQGQVTEAESLLASITIMTQDNQDFLSGMEKLRQSKETTHQAIQDLREVVQRLKILLESTDVQE